MAKAMPQLNILVLSFAVSALVGLVVMFLSVPEFQGAAGNVLSAGWATGWRRHGDRHGEREVTDG